MERVIAFLIIYMMNWFTDSLPIENGFTVKFNPFSTRRDTMSKNFGMLFAKVPQDTKTTKEEVRRDVFNKLFYVQSDEFGSYEHTNQQAKLVVPPKPLNATEMEQKMNIKFLNLPVISQPYDDYNILVATAPPNVNIGSGADNKKMVVYVVFPADGLSKNIEEMPKIYFVNEKSVRRHTKKEVVDPIMIVDSNRTVTGLKSKEVRKFVRFTNKLTNRFGYEVIP